MECTDISASIPEASGHLARANHKLGVIYASQGNVARSEACRKIAHDVRVKMLRHGDDESGDDGNGDSDEAFERLVLWMLW